MVRTFISSAAKDRLSDFVKRRGWRNQNKLDAIYSSVDGISWREPQRKFLLHKDMTDITAPYSIVADSPYIWVIFGGNGTDAAVWRGHLNKLMPVRVQ